MEKVLGQKIVLNNMVGAGGATGTAYVWQSKHNGYILCSANDSTPSHAVMTGMPQTTAQNWEFFIAGGSPGVLCVNAESGFKDFKTLLEAAQFQPGKIKVASCAGSVWFVQAAIFDKYCDFPLGNVPIPGTQPAILSCVAGETSAVVASIGEVADFVKAGKLIPLATMQDEDYEMRGYGTIPSIITVLPLYRNYLPLKQWHGFMVPTDTPEDVKTVLLNAFVTAMRSSEMETFRQSQHAVFYALSGKEAFDFAQKSESVTSWLLHEMNLTQHSPEKFGIIKP
jgi:tripartite-type tricarboxylate transporter receptor subunit TctC